jgi:hypothetical protein
LKHLNLKVIHQPKVEFKCDLCGTSVLDYRQLKVHMRTNHTRCKSSQFEEENNFEAYNCFYCNEPIMCKTDIEVHETVCLSMSNNQLQTETNVSPCDECDECGLLIKSKEELLRHMENNHKEEQHVKDVFWCDICPLNFESDWYLQFHRRWCHWDHRR